MPPLPAAEECREDAAGCKKGVAWHFASVSDAAWHFASVSSAAVAALSTVSCRVAFQRPRGLVQRGL
eukprot:CAMPEP_0168487756 /NCGR_PEP_ID=MMETSP0228-20121227/67804_1 /TAXON_ID=133427 /ORGANISM="Protoceratium reticulatum, Strain CCCM 535 (=CCMP 1889)" /LENGTH=66 /DNA_ID=CAMNT_0008504391 /DNA_START=82 /DNA_END=282 /DNA_ORIENTATION=+